MLVVHVARAVTLLSCEKQMHTPSQELKEEETWNARQSQTGDSYNHPSCEQIRYTPPPPSC